MIANTVILIIDSNFSDPKPNLQPKPPQQPHSPKTLKVAIIGEPNAGKSTLTNLLVGRKVCF